MSEEREHAMLSPSGAERWVNCPGSVAMEEGRPESTSAASEEGTAAHELAALCLTNGDDTAGYLGRVMSNGVAVDDEMVELIQEYIDHVRAIVEKTGGELFVEQKLPIGHVTLEAGATGTSDTVILVGRDKLLIICDLKYGHKIVQAEDNKQLVLYAAGAYYQFGLCCDIETVCGMIYQPRKNNYPEWSFSVQELTERCDHLREAAEKVWDICAAGLAGPGSLELHAGGHCLYCKAAADCPEQDRAITSLFGVGTMAEMPIEAHLFALDEAPELRGHELGERLDAVDFVEDWCKAVRARAANELQLGNEVIGAKGPYKLVKGRKGHRKWNDPEAAAKMLKGFRLKKDQMYDAKLISPTTAESLAKKKLLTEAQWSKLTVKCITQAEGKPQVAPADDPAPAIHVAIEEEFTDLTKADDLM